MLLWTGALLSGFLGYRLFGWWAPASVAGVVAVAQAMALQGAFGGQGGFIEALLLGGLMSLVMFFASYSIGRAIGLRRKGVR
jgi:hypothetical protein